MLRPDDTAPSVHDVDYEGLWDNGFRGVIFDLDNTLCPWHEDGLEPEVVDLLAKLQRRGFRVLVLSNGRLRRRRHLLGQFRELQVPVMWPAGKPCIRGFRRALATMELAALQVVMVGDQVFTDVLGANRVGMAVVLVSPVGPREQFLTRILRRLERCVGRV